MCALLKGPEKPYNKTYFKTDYIMYCFFFFQFTEYFPEQKYI